jgi:hypothetical protein
LLRAGLLPRLAAVRLRVLGWLAIIYAELLVDFLLTLVDG